MAPMKPYTGPLRRLLLAFDVGTTYSGVAYAFHDPGEVPEICAVNRYPGQETGDPKIPSILYYTQDGKVHAAGAEAASPTLKAEAEDDGLVFVEWFKLHLRPNSMIAGMERDTLPTLPAGKTAIDVFGDFLEYLFSCARRFITQARANGASQWESVGSRIDFILGHPNGWEGLQQSKMRQALVSAKLVTDSLADQSRVQFVSEGEASLHYCLDGGLAADAIKVDSKVLIIDAGEGTVDLSTYTFVSTSPITVHEVTAPDCILQGSTRVNVRAREYLKEKLQNSTFGNDDDINAMIEHFDRSTKPRFKDPEERSYVKFGSMRDRDPAVGIKNGQLQLSGREVERLFEPSVTAILEAVQKQCDAASGEMPIAFLVGGFATSPWLFSRLQASLRVQGIEVCRPEHNASKAVAEGAASFFLQKFVSSRVAKFTYGTEVSFVYDGGDPEHHARRFKLKTGPSGRTLVPEGFCAVLTKGARMRDNEEGTITLTQFSANAWGVNKITCDVTCYHGKLKDPKWIDAEPEMFSSLCVVHADTSAVRKEKHMGLRGEYYAQSFKLILQCGLTEMKAQLSWMEDGEEKRGPAEIVYDDSAVAV